MKALQRMSRFSYVIKNGNDMKFKEMLDISDIWHHSQLGIDIKGTI